MLYHYRNFKFSLFSLFIVIFCFALNNLYAQESNTQSEFPYNSSDKIDINPSTGSSSFNIKIDVPPGRGSVEPNLMLSYNSSLSNGIFGVGWALDLGSIQVSTKNGPPKYDGSDKYVMNGSQELVYNNTTNFYNFKNEEAFLRIEKTGSYWIVTDKNGRKLFFGQTSSSRQENGQNIFSWMLDRVEDIHGNYMLISYQKDGGYLYPLKIEYTGRNPDDLPFAEISFLLDSTNRPDSITSYKSKFLVTINKRIKEIQVKVNSQLQRKYVFNYDLSNSSYRSLLTSVSTIASNGISALPTKTFSYQEGKGFSLANNWIIPADAQFSKAPDTEKDLGVNVIDINGDAYPDLIKYFKDESNGSITKKTYLNNQNNGWDNSSNWVIPSSINPIAGKYPSSPPRNLDYGVKIVDINGDGYNDIIWHLKTNGSLTANNAYLSNKSNGWNNNNSSWSMPSGIVLTELTQIIQPIGSFSFTKPVIFSDVNADGFTDILVSDHSQNIHTAYINNGITGGTGWTQNNNWNPPSGEYTDFHSGATIVDLNGDNLPDIYYSNGTVRKVYLNNGNGWSLDSNSPWINTTYGNLTNGTTQFADVNGDGLADMIIMDNANSKIVINTGSGWQIDTGWNISEGNFQNLGTRLLDANADGMLDFMIHYNGNTPKVYLNQGNPTDLLKSMNNGVGGVQTLEYVPSTQFNNTFLPFPVQVVQSVTVSDSRGGSYVTQYEYTNGLWDSTEREFRGFGMVKTSDSDENYSETTIHQDSLLAGRPIEQKNYDSNDTLFSKTVNTWDTEPIATGIDFVFLKRKDNYIYDGQTTPKQTAEEFYYDETTQRGNLTKTIQLGDVNNQNDQRTIETFYVNNTAANLLGLPRQTIIKDSNGDIVRQSWFYYDNNSGNSDTPIKGLLTKKEDWNESNPKPTTTYSYDVYGNLKTTTDPLNHTTMITYDSDVNIFPISTKNALNHEVINEYYGVDGVDADSGDGFHGLWGQLKSTTDPNNKQGQRVYDEFGRLIKTVSPKDSLDYPTSEMEFNYFTNYMQTIVKQRVNHGPSTTIDSVTFTDGLGRVIQTKTKSGKAGKFIVNGHNEYNNRGLAVKQYLPFYSTSSITTLDAINPSNPHSTIVYDAMGRAVQTTNPDGVSHSNVEYNRWTTGSINENGHKQESDFDAYGRLIRKREYKGADGRGNPVYPAATYTLYAETIYEYDSEGNLTKTIDAHDNETIITYDKLGRKISMNDPDMGVWTYDYDLNGNLIKQTDAKAQEITFTYDDLNRLTNKTDGGSLNVSYTYDAPTMNNSKGRLNQAAYSGGDTQFDYDELGREVESIKKINNVDYSVDRNYDAINNLLDATYPNGGKVFYKYNDAGQIEAISNDDAILPQSSLSVEKVSQVALLRSPVTSEQPSAFSCQLSDKVVESLPATGDWKRATKVFFTQTLAHVSNFFVSEAFAATEDFSSFTVGPEGNVSTSTSCINYTSVASRDDNAYVYKNYSSFSDFTHKLDVKLTSSNDWSGPMLVWGISDTADDTYDNWSNGIRLGFYKGGSSPILALSEYANSVGNDFDDSVNLTLNTRYYLTVIKSGTSITVNIYSDSPRTNFVDTLTGTTTYSASTPYLYGLSAKQSATSGRLMTGDICNLDIGGSAPPDAPVQNNPTAGNGLVNLSWSSVTGATSYTVKYGTTQGGSYPSTYNAGNNLSTQITGLTNGTPYYFVVTASDGSQESSLSNEKSATPIAPSSTEDFTTFTVGPQGTVNTSTDCITYSSVASRNTNAYVYKDNGTGFGDFTHQLDAKLTSSNDWSGPMLVWGISDTAGDTYDNWSNGIRLGFYKGDSSPVLALSEYANNVGNDFDDSVNLTLNTRYYLTVIKSGTSITVNIYSDSPRTNLVDTLTGTTTYSASTPYLYGLSAKQSATNGRLMTGDVCNLDIGSTTPPSLSAPVQNNPTSGNGLVNLSWSSVSGATSYTVKYGTSQGGSYPTTYNAGNNLSAQITGLTNGTPYYFVVTASDGSQESSPSNEKTATPIAPPTGGNEDFTTFTVGPQGNVSTSEECITYTSVASRNSNAYVYKDNGTGFGDFTHQLDAKLTSSNDWSGPILVWGISDTAGDTYDNWSNGIRLGFYKGGSSPILALSEYANGVGNDLDDSVNLSLNTRYYLTVIKSGSYITVNIYSDPERTNQVGAPLTGTTTYSASTPYLYGLSAKQSATSGRLMTGDVCNLDIGSTAPPSLSAPVQNNPTAGNGLVNLSWGSVSGATSYTVKYGTTQGGSYPSTYNAGNNLSAQITGLNNGTPYYFVVTASDGSQESSPSNEKTATPSAPGSSVLFVEDVQYNAAGQIEQVKLGNGVTTNYTYDVNLRLTRIHTFDALNNVLQDKLYTYDPAGNILTIEDALNVKTQSFKYDEQARLIEAKGHYASGGTQFVTKTYEYDEIGNIKLKDGRTYTYGEGNAGPHAVSSLNDGSSFLYDLNGNMITRSENGVTTEYIYDSENRLIEVKKDGVTISIYTYDGDGGRTQKVADGKTTTFVGSLYENEGARATSHVFLGDTRVASITNGQVLFYHADHLGGANVITDIDADIKEISEYQPFGERAFYEKHGSDEEVAWYYFTSHYIDEETGLYFMQARYYDPSLGKFITPDTIVPYSNDPQSFNRYTYVRNNPTNLVDPDGHFFWFAALIGAAIGATVGGISAAINDQPIWQGILGGGLSGFGAGFGFAGGVAWGAVTGAGTSILSGGNPLIGAGLGAFGAALGRGAAGFLGDGASKIARASASILAGGIVGGIAAEAYGGSFANGFGYGAAAGLAGYTIGVGYTKLAGKVGTWHINKQIQKLENDYNKNYDSLEEAIKDLQNIGGSTNTKILNKLLKIVVDNGLSAGEVTIDGEYEYDLTEFNLGKGGDNFSRTANLSRINPNGSNADYLGTVKASSYSLNVRNNLTASINISKIDIYGVTTFNQDLNFGNQSWRKYEY